MKTGEQRAASATTLDRWGRPLQFPDLSPGRAGGRTPSRYGYVILGAGCAGLSLCYYLLELGVREEILILDKKPAFEDDRTWCFWNVEPTPFTHLAVHQWNSWSLHAGGRNVTQTSERYPYLCITGADFYEYALNELAAHGNVTVKLGEDVRGYRESGNGVRVETVEGVYESRCVFDGRGLAPGSPVFEEARREARWVPQRFVGQRIKTEAAVFDPGRCTLMDFNVDQSRGLRFMYVLPFSEQEALVESVYLSEAEASADTFRAEVSGYLSEAYGLPETGYEVLGEEQGYIPMTDYRFPRQLGERSYSIGMLGGESRPSTGYTFLRIQRYCRRLAACVVRGVTPPRRVDARRYETLDGLFLRFMQEYPERCPEVYRLMFEGVPPEPLVRFLTEKSSPADEARLVYALPKTPFIKLAGRTLLERTGR